jgi:hypothetical protein
MKQFTIQDIRSWKPCYNPNRYLPEDWSGTALDMLKHTTIPAKDKLWLVLRDSVMSSKDLRLFAVNCAKRAQTYPRNYTPDPRTLKAIEVAEKFTHGLASQGELAAAAYAAYAAANTADAADIKEAQMQYLYELLYINEIFEEKLLGHRTNTVSI